MGRHTSTIERLLQEAKELRAAGRVEEAIDSYSEALRLAPEDPELLWERATAHAQARDYHAALADMGEAIDRDPGQVHYYYVRGVQAFDLGSFAAATDDFSVAIKLEEDRGSEYYLGSAFFFRAWCHVSQGRFDDARGDARRVRDDMVSWGRGQLLTKEALMRVLDESS